MMRRRRRALAVSVAIAALAGCAGAPTTDESAPTSQAEFASSTADWTAAYVECARRYGADAVVMPDGSIDRPVAPGRERIDGLDAACVTEIGPPPAAPPASEALLIGMYELLLVQADCLRDLGHVVSDPPSRDEWVETYGPASWSPLGDVYAGNPAGLDPDPAQQCPQPDPVEAEAIGLAE